MHRPTVSSYCVETVKNTCTACCDSVDVLKHIKKLLNKVTTINSRPVERRERGEFSRAPRRLGGPAIAKTY